MLRHNYPIREEIIRKAIPPPKALDVRDRFYHILIKLNSLVIFLLYSLMAWQYGPLHGIVGIIFIGLNFLTGRLYRKKNLKSSYIHASIGILFLATGAYALLYGRTYSPLSALILLVPANALLLFRQDRSLVILWTAFAISILVSTWIFQEQLPLIVSQRPVARTTLFWGYSILAIGYVTYLLGHYKQFVEGWRQQSSWQLLEFERKIELLKGDSVNLKARNERLVQMYRNLMNQEEIHMQRADILSEAARVMDIKNRQIKVARDKFLEQSNKLEDIYEDLQNSIRYAQKIQEAIIPEASWVEEHFRDAFIFYRPKDIVSGDFYWFDEVKTLEGRVKILIAADCTGHGVPGAFMTVLGSSILNEIVHEMYITRPDSLLAELDRKIMETLSNRTGKAEIHDGMDMVVLTIHEDKRIVQYAAAHNPVYYVRQQKLEKIKGSRFPVGSAQYRTKKEFKLHTIDVEPGDVFYIFTDGFQDQFGSSEKRKYMTRRFRNFLLSINRLPLQIQKERLAAEFDNWKGDIPQTDDVMVIGFRV